MTFNSVCGWQCTAVQTALIRGRKVLAPWEQTQAPNQQHNPAGRLSSLEWWFERTPLIHSTCFSQAGRGGGSCAHTRQPRMQWHKMLEVGAQKAAGRWAEDPGLWGNKQGLVQGSPGKTPYGAAVKGKSAKESCLVFKGTYWELRIASHPLGRLNS